MGKGAGDIMGCPLPDFAVTMGIQRCQLSDAVMHNWKILLASEGQHWYRTISKRRRLGNGNAIVDGLVHCQLLALSPSTRLCLAPMGRCLGPMGTQIFEIAALHMAQLRLFLDEPGADEDAGSSRRSLN